MRVHLTLLYGLAALAFGLSNVSADQTGILRRDSTASASSSSLTTTATSSVSSSFTSSDTASQTTSTASKDAPSVTGSTSSLTSSVTNLASSSPVSASGSVSSALPTSANGTITNNPNSLPFQPKITPGLAVAGVILLLSGLFYTLIGIKNKWLQISLSTAYLTSLSVTVLVIYVMNPPVNNAIQGAYVVAAVITGIIFGSLSIVFPEVTEGLGCLLGGFCVGMWFLVLKPGGLVTSTTGRVILVVAFCLSFFALSFSHFTRTYGLIGCTSFAGATSIILGIDCFSRAGLKEFWLYIWNLNNNIFPLGTTTFPHTRGIRVEIAAIILISIMGVMSQMKLWKVVKEKREKRMAARLQDERNLEAEEADVGRRVESENNRDRAEWEAVYGDKDRARDYHTDSGLGDELESIKRSREGSEGTPENSNDRNEPIELAEMETSRPPTSGRTIKNSRISQDGSAIVVRVAPDEETRGNLFSKPAPASAIDRVPSRPASRRVSGIDTSAMATVPEHESSPLKSGHVSRQNSVSPAPVAVPLPFTVPAPDNEKGDDGSSIATFADSDHAETSAGPMRNMRRNSKRGSRRSSQGSLFRRLSGRRSRAMSTETESLVIPHDDDHGSSLVATIDDDRDDIESLDLDEIHAEEHNDSVPAQMGIQEVKRAEDEKDAEQKIIIEEAEDAATSKQAPNRSSYQSTLDGYFSRDASRPTSYIATEGVMEEMRPRHSFQSDRQFGPSGRENLQGDMQIHKSRSRKSVAGSEVSVKTGRQSLRESLNEQFPARLSKVVMTYRTNEWAKHLTAADKPEADEIVLPEFVAEPEKGREQAAPVVVEELQQTAANAVPPPAPRSMSQMSMHSNPQVPVFAPASGVPSPQFQPHHQMSRSTSTNSFHHTMNRSLSQTSLYNPTHGALLPSSSTPQLTQQPPAAAFPRGIRSSSTPLLHQPLVESPIEESAAADFPGASLARSTPSPLPQNTLMGRRDTLLRNKFSISSTQLAPTPETAASSIIAPNDSASAYDYQVQQMYDDDNIPLSQRRELMRASSQSSQLGAQVAMGPLVGAPKAQEHSFDSHQPKRDSGPTPERRELMMASWRESIRQDLASTVPPKIAVEARREEMMAQRQQSLLSQKQREAERGARDSIFDERMRRGDMLDLHKEVIRKMQATANKNI